ncbi:DNA glycosylase [Xylariales sp. PMI_506]|nr:DNA glycosylase [Xylariales sp. PMI_506]
MSRIRRKRTTPSDSDAYQSDESEEAPPVTKKRKVVRTTKRLNGNSVVFEKLFGQNGTGHSSSKICTLPTRIHPLEYHRPMLLDKQESRSALLKWFDAVTTVRGMPWRKSWIDPRSISDTSALRPILECRAYEVWISEIMLQQTRVAVVIDYWNRWMEKWPTIQDLATASSDDVLAAWRGLGYYSRATRIHEAAKLVCGDETMRGLLPSSTADLDAKVPGVGRYTAGAISAIVFGRAAPMVDGNVLRVLSRQLGVFGDVKGDKAVIDMLWAAADSLVKAVGNDMDADEILDSEGFQVSDRPGRWGQALMELGSTICTPKPNCASCPITSTCRVYAEGQLHSAKKMSATSEAKPLDIEDSCNFCQRFEEYAVPDEEDEQIAAQASAKKPLEAKKQSSLQSYFSTRQTTKAQGSKAVVAESNSAALSVITNHARKFPIKVVKKAVREEETLVCAIRRKSDGHYLIHKRPDKGLLAGLWEFPSHILPDSNNSTTKGRKAEALRFVEDLVSASVKKGELRYSGELGNVPWLFSHLRLTMYVHLFELNDIDGDGLSFSSVSRKRWSGDVDQESMGTGMRKCWSLIQETFG